jgi:integrase
MWTWAQRERGLSLANPTTGVQRAKEEPRVRYLLPAELQRLYAVLEADSGQASEALLLLLLTGQRKGTISGLRWSEVDFRDAVLKIPAARMKSGREHTVPLAGAALDILKARQAAAKPKARFVFPTWGKRHHLYDLRRPFTRILEDAEIEGRCTPHDLRRTWATYCRELGRDPAPILGHAPQGVTERHYSMNTIGALRETMRATVNHIVNTATTESGKVVGFPSVGNGRN